MSTEEGTAARDDDVRPGDDADTPPRSPEPGDGSGDGSVEATRTDAEPSWWHRDHPTFAALLGFYTGLVTVIVLPGAFAAVLAATVSTERSQGLYPLVLLVFAIPLAMLAFARTRRFARYMLLGMVLTAVVVVGVAALVFWILIRADA